jgi:hypothetical protein
VETDASSVTGLAYRRAVLDGAGTVALAIVVWLIAATDQYSLFLYHGGILLLSLATAVVVAVIVHPASRWGRLLGLAPLQWVGERSYGIYLWHLPVIVAFAGRFGVGARWSGDLLAVALIVALASLSWTFVEDPIRQRGLSATVAGWRRSVTHHGARLVAVGATAALVFVGGSVSVLASTNRHTSSSVATTTAPIHTTTTVTSTTMPVAIAKSSCRVVTYDGDSTSDGLISTSYLPNPDDRFDARLRGVGVTTFHPEIAGAQSIVETWHNEPNAQTRIAREWARGVRGCWIFALGTNDAANTSFRNLPAAPRIDAMMSLVHGEPVMWLTVKTLLSSSPYADVQMRKWNTALEAACRRYPNMRVYDWRSEVQSPWYISDGIHFTSPGYWERSRRIAAALRRAFPDGHASPAGCLVPSGMAG